MDGRRKLLVAEHTVGGGGIKQIRPVGSATWCANNCLALHVAMCCSIFEMLSGSSGMLSETHCVIQYVHPHLHCLCLKGKRRTHL